MFYDSVSVAACGEPPLCHVEEAVIWNPEMGLWEPLASCHRCLHYASRDTWKIRTMALSLLGFCSPGTKERVLIRWACRSRWSAPVAQSRAFFVYSRNETETKFSLSFSPGSHLSRIPLRQMFVYLAHICLPDTVTILSPNLLFPSWFYNPVPKEYPPWGRIQDWSHVLHIRSQPVSYHVTCSMTFALSLRVSCFWMEA